MGCCLSCCKSEEEPSIEDIMADKEGSIKMLEHVNYPFQNLVFEGCATNITVAMGAYKVLYDVGISQKLKKFAGSSSGSIMATIAATHMTPQFIWNEFMSINTDDFLDDSFGIISDINRFMFDNGLYKGDELEEWVESVLYKHTEIKRITFRQVFEMYGSKLVIVICNLSKLKTEYMSIDTSPNMAVSEAIRWSTSLPLVFKSPRTLSGDIILDGGFGDNYALSIFDNGNTPNMKTMGIKIMDEDEEKRNSKIVSELSQAPSNVMSYVMALANFQFLMAERAKIKPGNKFWERTISLNSPDREFTDFSITAQEKADEFEMGVINTISYLHKYKKNKHF